MKHSKPIAQEVIRDFYQIIQVLYKDIFLFKFCLVRLEKEEACKKCFAYLALTYKKFIN